MFRFALRRRLVGAGALMTALTLAACGGAGDLDSVDGGQSENGTRPVDGDSTEPTELTPVTVGYFPLVHTASVVHAFESGYFEAEGLDVELVQTAGGATVVPPLVAGEYDIAYSNYTSILLGAQQGLPLTIVAGNDVGADDHSLLVTENSEFRNVLHLEGASVAVSNLANIGTVATRALVEEAGGDGASIEFVEIQFPEMYAALERGDVDAIWQVEPFQAIALDAGAEVLVPLFSGPVENMPVAGWLATTEFAGENGDVVEAFRRAMAAAVEDLSDDRELLVEIVPTYTEVSVELVEQVSMPRWTVDVDVDALAHMEDLMFQYGVTTSEFDVATVIWE